MHTQTIAPPRSALVHLCWKELRLIVPAHVAIVCAAVVGVFATLAVPNSVFGFSVVAESPILLWNTVNILSAVVCAAVFHGMDRENGSWAWQSSLPVSWQMSAGSRLLVAGSVFLFLGSVGWLLIGNLLFAPTDKFEFATTMLLGGILWFQSYCIFSIALMLAGDVLWGLVSAAAMVIGLQAILPLPIGEVTGDLLILTATGADLVFWRVATLMSVQFVLLVALLSIHAWRWNHGCYSDLANGLRSRFGVADLIPANTLALDVANSKTQPGRFRSLLWLSFRQYLLLKLVVGFVSVASLARVYSVSAVFPADSGWITTFVIGALLFLGVSVFGGDQARRRHVAVSSRGVSPEMFWIAKFLGPAGLAVLTLFAMIPATYSSIRSELASLVFAYGLLVYVAAQLCGLCFRSVVVAVIVTVIVGWLFALANILGFWVMPLEMGDPITPVWMIALAIAGLLMASCWCCRRLFVLDNPRLVRSFVWIASGYLVLAFLFGAGSKYAAIPNVAWRGGTLDSLPASIARMTQLTANRANSNAYDFRVVDSGIKAETTALIDQHFDWAAHQKWLANPTRYASHFRYPPLIEPVPLTTEEIESVKKEIQLSLARLEQFFTEEYGRFSGVSPHHYRLDRELMHAAAFCLDQELWPEATKLLTMMGRLRTSPFSRAHMGRLMPQKIFGYVDTADCFGPEQVTAMGGPVAVRALLRPLFFTSDEAETFVADVLTTLRFDALDSPEVFMTMGVGGKSYREYMGYGPIAGSVSEWILRHLNRKLAAVHLKSFSSVNDFIRQQALEIRNNPPNPASPMEFPVLKTASDLETCPYTNQSLLAYFMCSSATSLSFIWEVRISPLLDQMERDQQNRGPDQKNASTKQD